MGECSYCVLVYIRKKTTLILDGKMIVFLPKQLILIRSNKHSDLISDSSKTCIKFSSELLCEYIFFSRNDFIKTKKIYRKNHISIQSDNVEIISGIFNKLPFIKEQSIKKTAIFFLLSYFHVEHHFFSFFLSFFSMRHKISAIIKTDIRHQWRLKEISSALCLCASTVKKHLKKEETTFIKILTECRMQYAARMLLISNKNINSISAECGYNSASYFIMTFRNYYGLSPHHYAQKHSFLLK